MTTKEVVEVEEIEATEKATDQLYLASALVKEEETLQHFADIISGHNAEIKKSESLGQKQLSYPINKQSNLFLVSVFFTAARDSVPKIEADLNTDEMIERALVTT